ncbi:hypothetical protein [Bradyrhizobium sp.]|uniref:hypothetical protein n=1 Tax=Bradyrhizobium sp. TaxID=376 RepID=UPI003C5AD858
MKKHEAHVARSKLGESRRSIGDALEAPVQLTPEQIEIVAGGFSATGGFLSGKILPTTTTGALPPPPDYAKDLMNLK